MGVGRGRGRKAEGEGEQEGIHEDVALLLLRSRGVPVGVGGIASPC